jgi:MFS family permease
VDGERILTGPFLRIWIADFAAFASFGVVLLALPLYAKDELGTGSVGVGFAMGAASVTAVLFGPPSGRLADRRGRMPLVLGGTAVMLACYLALTLSPSLAAVILIRLLAGVGEMAFAVAAFTAATDLAPEHRRGEAMSLITIGSYLGLTIGSVSADLALGDGRFTLVWLLAAGCVAVSGASVLTLGETRPQTEDEAPAGWLPPRGALLPGLFVLIALLGFGGFNAFAAIYAREIGFDRPGLVFGLFGIVVVLVRTLGRKVPDRLGGRRTLAFSFACLAAGLATVGVWQAVPGLLIGTIVFAVGQALTFPAAILLALSATSPAERSAVVGGVTAFVDVALGLGAFTLGGVAALAGYGGAFLTAAGVALSGLVLLAALRAAPGAAPQASAAEP